SLPRSPVSKRRAASRPVTMFLAPQPSKDPTMTPALLPHHPDRPAADREANGALQRRVAELEARLAALEAAQKDTRADLPDNRVSLIIFSGDLDKVLAGFVIATGAAAVGMEVSMFFTFW